MLFTAGIIPIVYLACLPLLSEINYAYRGQKHAYYTENPNELIDISWFLETPAAVGGFSGAFFFGMIFQWDVLEFTKRFDLNEISIRKRGSLNKLNIAWIVFVMF